MFNFTLSSKKQESNQQSNKSFLVSSATETNRTTNFFSNSPLRPQSNERRESPSSKVAKEDASRNAGLFDRRRDAKEVVQESTIFRTNMDPKKSLFAFPRESSDVKPSLLNPTASNTVGSHDNIKESSFQVPTFSMAKGPSNIPAAESMQIDNDNTNASTSKFGQEHLNPLPDADSSASTDQTTFPVNDDRTSLTSGVNNEGTKEFGTVRDSTTDRTALFTEDFNAEQLRIQKAVYQTNEKIEEIRELLDTTNEKAENLEVRIARWHSQLYCLFDPSIRDVILDAQQNIKHCLCEH